MTTGYHALVIDTQRRELGGLPATFHGVRDPEMASGRDRATENINLSFPRVEPGAHYVPKLWDLGHIPEFDHIYLYFLIYRK